MSTISVSNITTANGSEPLTIATGNAAAGDIILPATGGVVIGPNSTINSIIVSTGSTANMLVTNSTGVFFPTNTTFNGNLLFVDATNNRVGIKNTAPTSDLTVTGNVDIDAGVLFVDGVNNRVAVGGNTTPAVTLQVTGTMNVSTNTFNLGASTLAANGYVFLPFGLKLNWGRVAAANTAAGTFATFSSPYASAPYIVQVSHQSGVMRNVPPMVITSNTTGANISSGNAATTGTNVFFMAIGL